MQTYNCFLLSYLKYGDNDAILHCFSKENGYQSFFAKGIYTPKNKKKPYLFPLNLLQITTLKSSTDQSILRVSKIELDPDFYDFSEISEITILFFIADFLHQVLREEGSNQQLFSSIKKLKQQISLRNSDAYLVFIFTFLKISGLAPLYSDKRYLNPEIGIFEEELSHSLFNLDISEVWRNLLTSDDCYNLKLKRSQRSDFLDTLMIYCQFHLNNFYTPQSLAIVREIFD